MAADTVPSHIKRNIDPSLDRVVLLDQLHSDAWAEGIAIRPTGHALATIIDTSEVYTLDLRRPSPNSVYNEDDYRHVPTPKVLLNLPDSNAVYNIIRLTGTEREEYAVLCGFADLATQALHSARLWRLSFDPQDLQGEPTRTKIADLPDALFPFGMEVISDSVLAIVDSTKFCIWRVHIPTGKVSVLFEHKDSMKPSTTGEFFGVNRVRVKGGFMWYTNTSTGVLSRAPIEYTDSARSDIRVTSPPQTVVDGLDHADGLVVHKDGSAAYVASYVLGNIWRVDVDPATGKGTKTVLLDDLLSPTAMELNYDDKTTEKPTLYVVCCGAMYMDRAKGDWVALTNVDVSKLRIMVTVETTVTYESIAA